MSNNNEFQVDIKFPKDIRFEYDKGKELNTGEIEGKIYTFDTRYEVARNAFPGGFLATNAVQKIGDKLEDVKPISSTSEPIFLKVYGYFSLDLNRGRTPVKYTAKEKISITATVNNRELPFKKPENVSLWSYDEANFRWIKEQTKYFNKTESGNQVTFQVDHLSYFMVGEDVNACTVPVNLTFSNTQSFRSRYVKMSYGGGTGQIHRGILNFPGKGFYNIGVYAPRNEMVTTEILSGSYHNSAMLGSQSFDCASSVDTFKVPSQDPLPPCEEIEFRINCNSGDCFLPNYQGLFFTLRDVSGRYNYAGMMTNGRINLDHSILKGNNRIYFTLQYNENVVFSLNSIIKTDSSTGEITLRGNSQNGNLRLSPSIPSNPKNCAHKTIFDINISNCAATFPGIDIGTPCN